MTETTEPKKRDCIICTNESQLVVTKGITEYFQCINCKTVFCNALDNENMVGGKFEVERNEKENHLRIERINEITKGLDKNDIWILDFGCGTGYLIEDLKKEGYKNVDGYDAYNEKYSKLPEKNKYHVVVSVETFEHFAFPFVELDVINRCLLNYGCCYVETGYIDAAIEDGHTVENYFYLAPEAGHSTIFSHHGIDLLMAYRGFLVKYNFNKHCKLFQKLPV